MLKLKASPIWSHDYDRNGYLKQHELRVHYIRMRNITLSADEAIIKKARQRASNENVTINELFRAWLNRYVSQSSAVAQYDQLMQNLIHISATGPYSRDEMNERR